MNSPLNQTLLAFWRQRDPANVWVWRVCAGLLLLGLAVGLWLEPGATPRLALANAVIGVAALVTWLAVGGSLLEQNHPHAARFVPGHLRALRQAALLAWALTTCVPVALLGAWAPGEMPLTALLLGFGSLTVYLLWAMRDWTLWLLPAFGPLFFGTLDLRHRLAPLWTALLALWSAQPGPVTVLALLALGWLVTRAFGNGDAAHQAAYARGSRMRKAMREGQAGQGGLKVYGRPGEWMARPFDAIIAAWLRRLLARAQPGEASAMARLEVVLHGQQHWLRQLLATVFIFSLVAIGLTVAFQLAGPAAHEGWKQGAAGMAIGLASAGFNPGFMLPNTLWQTRREQALLALLPGVPQGGRLNRAVARMQLRHFLVGWALTSAPIVVLAARADNVSLLGLPIAALPVGLFMVLRAPARLQAPRPLTVVLPVLGLFALFGVLMLPVHLLGWPVWPLALASTLLSAGIAAWRWPALRQAPAALPAGRLA